MVATEVVSVVRLVCPARVRRGRLGEHRADTRAEHCDKRAAARGSALDGLSGEVDRASRMAKHDLEVLAADVE